VRNCVCGILIVLVTGTGAAIAQVPVTELPPLPSISTVPSGDPIIPSVVANPSTPSRIWGSSDLLMWHMKGINTPPLVVTGTAAVVGPTVSISPIPTAPGFIGLQTFTSTTVPTTLDNSTHVLSPNQLDQGNHTGGRFFIGGWLDDEHTFGIEGGYFFLGNRGRTFSVNSDQFPSLAIPFRDAITGQESGYQLAQPTTVVTNTTSVNTTPGVFVHLTTQTITDVIVGGFNTSSSTSLNGFEVNGIWNAFNVGDWRFELLAGFRNVQLDDRLAISSMVTQNHTDVTSIEPALGIPKSAGGIVNSSTTASSRFDQFSTRNSFYGEQLGARGAYSWGRFSLEGTGKLAMGSMTESINVAGSSSVTQMSSVTPTTTILLAGIPLVVPNGIPGPTTTSTTTGSGGFFAQPTNSGHFSRNVFAVVPEANVRLGIDVTNWCRATVGYSFLFMSSVVRSSDQIDRTINSGQLASPPVNGDPARPLVPFKSTDFWAQGVDFGVQFRF
jgi:Putative beta barrel porin-7 (BBP7)